MDKAECGIAIATLTAAINERDAEIERLRADLLTARGQAEDLSGEVARLRELRDTMLKGEVAIRQRDADEIERLRGVLSSIREAVSECGYQTEQLPELIKEICAEALGE